MSEPLNILMFGEIASAKADDFKPRLPADWQLNVWDPAGQSNDEFEPLLAAADAIVGGPIPLPSWPETPRLKLYQVPWAGYDWASAANVPNGVAFCNCYEHESAIAEYVMLTILESRIGLRRMDSTFRAGGWNGTGPGRSVFHGEVQGTTLGIIGYGHIGEQVARRAAAFGMRVIGVRRTEQRTPEPLAWLGTSERTDELLAQSDFVLIACDLNEQTRGMINAGTFAAMKKDAFIINVARGAIINESDLFQALASKSIGGAIIDTWYNYPTRDNPDVWPASEPFQELENIILSAHESGWTHEVVERRWQFVAANLARLHNGEPLQNLLFNGTAQPQDGAQ